MTGPDAALIVAAPVVLMCVLAGVAQWIDRHWLGAAERADARRRNQAHAAIESGAWREGRRMAERPWRR